MKNLFSSKFSYITAIGVILAHLSVISCSQEDNNIVPDKDANETVNIENALDKYESMVSLSENPQRTEAEAIKLLGDFINSSQSPSLSTKKVKANPFLDIEDVKYVIRKNNEPKTYSSPKEDYAQAVDTAVYVFNFKDNNGFALVSGDKRVADILAVTESGRLDERSVSDIESTGLAVYLSRLPAFFKQKLDRFNMEMDSLETLINEPETYIRRRRYYYYTYSDWKTTETSPNLVKVTWGQGYPYNNEAPYIRNSNGDKERAAAGCVATALAQLISAHKYPAKFRGVSLDWNLLTKHPSSYDFIFPNRDIDRDKYNTMIAKFYRKIGDALDNDWGEETNAKTSAIPKVLKEMGYSNPSSQTEFDPDAVFLSITQQKPVILSGFEEKITKGWWIFKHTHYEGGHAWVADSYKHQIRTAYKISKSSKKVLSTHTQNRTLIHCNWGWSGGSNGYFLRDVFDSNNPVEPTTYSKKEYYFQYKITNILYVAP